MRYAVTYFQNGERRVKEVLGYRELGQFVKGLKCGYAITNLDLNETTWYDENGGQTAFCGQPRGHKALKAVQNV